MADLNLPQLPENCRFKIRKAGLPGYVWILLQRKNWLGLYSTVVQDLSAGHSGAIEYAAGQLIQEMKIRARSKNFVGVYYG